MSSADSSDETSLTEPCSTLPSHDTTWSDSHVSWPSWGSQLKLAVDAAWPARHGCRYLDVKFLALTWKSDDLGVIKEAKAANEHLP